MFEFCEIEELANQVNLSNLYEIAKNSAQIGNEILKVNYNKIQKISSKGRNCLLYTSPSPRDGIGSRMPSSA